MQLDQLAQERKLIKLTIEDEGIVEKYGEALEFWVWDRQSLDTFAKMSVITEDNALQYTDLLTDMILNKEGEPVMRDNKILPVDVITEAIKLVGETLGK